MEVGAGFAIHVLAADKADPAILVLRIQGAAVLATFVAVACARHSTCTAVGQVKDHAGYLRMLSARLRRGRWVELPLSAPIKKAPGRTEFQRGILTATAGGAWSVRTTGDQGSGILSSMSQANCFIILGSDTGNVAAAELVEVQLLEGLV